MTSTTHLPSHNALRESRRSWLYMREFWATVSISFMWLAVLFTGVYGGDAVFTGNDGTSTRLPTAVFVAFFALLASASVGKRAFGSVERR